MSHCTLPCTYYHRQSLPRLRWSKHHTTDSGTNNSNNSNNISGTIRRRPRAHIVPFCLTHPSWHPSQSMQPLGQCRQAECRHEYLDSGVVLLMVMPMHRQPLHQPSTAITTQRLAAPCLTRQP